MSIEPVNMVCYNSAMPKINLFKNQAKKLRKQGYSYNLINQRLGIAKSSLSNWFKDLPYNPNKKVLRRIKLGPIKSAQKRHNDKVGEINQLRLLGAEEIGKLSHRDLWLLGLGLYIGEGSKSHEIIRIINSNPEVIKMAIRWFKEACHLKTENISIAIHIYPDNNIKNCIKFWKKSTGLPSSCFRKTQIDARKNKLTIKKHMLPYGTAHITIVSNGNIEKGVRLFRRMEGWMLGALSQTNIAGIV